MKKTLIYFIAFSVIIAASCKKKEVKKEEGPIGTKYAKYRVAVRKGKDLKKWLATLEKTEEVQLLAEEDVTNEKGKTYKVMKVKLSDDKVGYIKPRHLANGVIVFSSDTKAHDRPTIGSRVRATIPKGTIGFIIDEKAHWAQIYVGKISGKWVTKQWVKGGYVTDSNVIVEAKEYEKTMAMLNSKGDKKELIEKVLKKLEEMSQGTSVMAQIAKDELQKLNEKKEEILKKDEEEKNKEKDPTKESDKNTTGQ